MSLIQKEISSNNKLDKIISNDFKFVFNPFSKFFSFNPFYYFLKIIILFLLSILSIEYIVKLFLINPKKILFLHAHSNNDKILLLAAKILNIKTESLVHSWDNPTTKLSLSLKSDRYYTWNNEIKKEMSYLNDISTKKIISLGIIQFDSYFRLVPKLRKKQKTILIFLPSTGLVSEENQKYFLERFLENKNLNKFNIIIRFHPGIKFNWLKLLEKKYKYLKLNTPENIVKADKTKDLITKTDLSKNSIQKLLINADIVINYFSTTSLDACFFEIPIINISINKKNENSIEWYYKWSHYDKLLKFNAIHLCNNFKNLNKKLKYFSKKNNLKNKKAKVIKEKLIMNNDGLSGLRLSERFFHL